MMIASQDVRFGLLAHVTTSVDFVPDSSGSVPARSLARFSIAG